MAATEVIIYFVGLCMFTASVPNDLGMHVILPRVPARTVTGPPPDRRLIDARVPREVMVNTFNTARVDLNQATISLQPSTSATTPAAPSTAPIDPHIAVLIFRSDLYQPAKSTWKALDTTRPGSPIGLTKLTGYSYVVLDGEQITFITDSGANPAPKAFPGALPHFAAPGDGTKLTPEFQWPYTGAAAMIDLPEGSLSSCKQTGDQIAPTRVDSTLKLNTTKTITVVARKWGTLKTLVLEVDPARMEVDPVQNKVQRTIYVANVPKKYLDGSTAPHTDMDGQKHYLEYFKMVGKNLNADNGLNATDTSLGSQCGDNPALLPRYSGQTGSDNHLASLQTLATITSVHKPIDIGVMHVLVADAECSNTQWP